jgi:cytochrome P450
VDQPEGPVYDPFSNEIDDDPYPLWARMIDEAPLYWSERYSFFALTRYADVEAAFLDPATYRSGHGTVLELLDAPVEVIPDWLLFKDAPEHTRLRSLVNKAFTPRRVAELEPQIRSIASELLARHDAGETFDCIGEFARQLPMRVISSLLGVPEDDMEKVQNLFHAFQESQVGDSGFDFSTLEAINQYFCDMAAERRSQPRDDMMTALVEAEISDPDGGNRKLTEKELSEFVVLLDGAGTDTVSLNLGNLTRELEANPEQRQLLAREPELSVNAIEEILRFDPPSPVQGRLVTHDVELHGTVVPEISKLLLINGAASRDPRVYEDPNRFDVSRHFDRHLSFGFGTHYCLGAALARLESRIALEELLRRFPEYHVHVDEAVRIRTSSVRGYRSLPMTV